tara:strand:- start:92 stop:451 length:360 start_codon:yes stop_codon:yes gene_type:complete
MNNRELETQLKDSGAAYLERITHFDGDRGRWVVRDQTHAEVEVPLHPNELLNRISALNLELLGVEHPSWKKEREAFERANATDLAHGGGFAHNAAFNRWAQLCETPGDNMRLIVWDVKE